MKRHGQGQPQRAPRGADRMGRGGLGRPWTWWSLLRSADSGGWPPWVRG